MKKYKSGIYKITNIVNLKIYVGSAKNLQYRKSRHFSQLRKNKHFNLHLQNAFNKYGEENFKFEVIEYVEVEKLIEREKYWIAKLDVIKNGYNICHVSNSKLGTKTSEETKKRISESLKKLNRKMSEDNKIKLILSHKGKHLSKELREKISNANKGIHAGNKNPMYGKNHTDEAKRKMSIKATGRKLTEEAKKKISKKVKGEKNGFYGKHHTEENKKKMSEKKKGLYCLDKSVNAKKVLCVEKDIIFNSITEAHIKTGANKGNISAVCLGKRKTCGGFTWKYV